MNDQEPIKDSLTETFEAIEAKLSHYKATRSDEMVRFFIPEVGQINWSCYPPVEGVSYLEHKLTLMDCLHDFYALIMQSFGFIHGYLLASPKAYAILSTLPSATRVSERHTDIMMSPILRVVRDDEIRGSDVVWLGLPQEMRNQ